MIALATEIVGIGRNVSREIGGIIIGTNLGRKLAADHDKPRGSTQRRIAICRVESDALLGQPVQIGRLHGRVLVMNG